VISLLCECTQCQPATLSSKALLAFTRNRFTVKVCTRCCERDLLCIAVVSKLECPSAMEVELVTVMILKINVPTFIKNTQKELLCIASPIRDNNSHSVQLQAVRFNGLCRMQMLKAPLETVSRLGSEWDRLRSDNSAFRLPLHRLPLHTVLSQGYFSLWGWQPCYHDRSATWAPDVDFMTYVTSGLPNYSRQFS
jgi:hypothetical protein